VRALLSDLRLAARNLARRPGYAAATIAILALGVGANAAIFSIVKATLLAPLPFPDSDRLVRIWETYSKGEGRGAVSLPNFRDWRAEADAFESMAAYWFSSRNVQGVAEPERIEVIESTASFFDVLGAQPALGRFYTAGEEQLEASPVVVLTDRFWRPRFAADPSIVGRTILLDGIAHPAIGVARAEFDSPVSGTAIQAYLAHRPLPWAESRGAHYMSAIGKLRPGAALATGREQLERIAARLEREHPDQQTGRGVEVETLSGSIRGPVRESLVVLLAAVGLVLAIACANLVGLALARAAGRHREVSIRAALGATHRQLARELLVESLLLAAGGVAAGALVARALLALLAAHAAETLPRLAPIALDRSALLFLAAVGAGTGAIFGLVPAWSATREALGRDLVESSARTTAGRSRQRVRRALVAAQVALSVTLLLGAGLLVRTFLRLQATPPGFDRVGFLSLHLNPAKGIYEDATVTPKLLAPMLERVRALPGVEAAGVVSLLPIQQWGSNTSYTIDGLEPPPPGSDWWVESRAASPGAFEALGIPLVAGRPLAESDVGAEGRPYVCLVNQAFVRRHFPDGQALERVVRFSSDSFATIVGVVGDTRQAGLDQEPLPELTPSYADPRNGGTFLYDTVLVVRTGLPPASLTPAVRAAIAAVDPAQPIPTVRTLGEVVEESLGERRFNLLLVAAFGAVAIALAATGLYALGAYLVAQRTREFGVRMALGATARTSCARVVREGLGLAALGVALGLAGGFAASRLLASQLAGVHPLDPVTWLAVAGFLVLVALAASAAPALRAARVDAVHVLRQE
jgi:predicted permease